jgi:hypothetical protein
VLPTTYRVPDATAYLSLTRILGEPGRLLEGYRSTDAVMTEVGRTHGLLVHAAAATGEGLLIVNLWPSRAGSEAAAGDPRRLGVLAQLGLGPEDFRREHHDVANHVLFG